MFHNILVAVDGSPDSEEALRQAIDLAQSEDARLTLISGAHELPASSYLVAGEILSGLLEEARAAAEAVLERARERVPENLSATTLVAEQPIRTALIRQVEEGRHDLLVMGSRGRGAVRAALLGSVSHYALHHSPVPVLIVHELGSRPRPPAQDPASGSRAAAHATAAVL